MKKATKGQSRTKVHAGIDHGKKAVNRILAGGSKEEREEYSLT